ncbi:MAG TPA: SRPBCC domain-containing protein [Thermoleophilia bacterium]|nr:SRPBCC domain-containing protein [Thermoleophilia bacterium]
MASPIQVGSMTFTQPNDTQLVATRTIGAPRALVWAAHTECGHVQKWLLGPEGWKMPVCEIDLRPGGKWRYAYEGPDGAGFQMSGEYREIQAPERLVNTERMDDSPGEALDTMTLTEEGGHTVVVTVVEYPSQEIRDQIIATGMMDGWAESYDRLEEYLRSMK